MGRLAASRIRTDVRRRLSGGAVACAVVALLALGAAPAGAAFSPPFGIPTGGTTPPAGQNAFDPQVASDAEGDAIVAWADYGLRGFSVRAYSIDRNNNQADKQPLSPFGPEVRSPQVASDADGDTIVVWERFDGSNWRIEARRITGSASQFPGSVTGLMTLSPPGRDAHNPQVATDAGGNAVVAWERFHGTYWRVEARSISRVGALGPLTTLSPNGGDAHAPAVASDAGGGAVVAWEGPRTGPAQTSHIQARSVSVRGLGPIMDLSADGQDGFRVQLASDADGDAIAVWDRAGVIQARRISPPRTLGPIQNLGAPGANTAQVAIDADGDALAAWYLPAAGLSRVEARTISAAGVLGPVRDLSGNVGADDVQVASDADGERVAVWEVLGTSPPRVQARTVSAAGVLGPIQTLSTSASEPERGGVNPQIASDADGDAIAVWKTLVPTGVGIQASRGP
jgi:hypothetical protein